MNDAISLSNLAISVSNSANASWIWADYHVVIIACNPQVMAAPPALSSPVNCYVAIPLPYRGLSSLVRRAWGSSTGGSASTTCRWAAACSEGSPCAAAQSLSTRSVLSSSDICLAVPGTPHTCCSGSAHPLREAGEQQLPHKGPFQPVLPLM